MGVTTWLLLRRKSRQDPYPRANAAPADGTPQRRLSKLSQIGLLGGSRRSTNGDKMMGGLQTSGLGTVSSEEKSPSGSVPLDRRYSHSRYVDQRLDPSSIWNPLNDDPGRVSMNSFRDDHDYSRKVLRVGGPRFSVVTRANHGLSGRESRRFMTAMARARYERPRRKPPSYNRPGPTRSSLPMFPQSSLVVLDPVIRTFPVGSFAGSHPPCCGVCSLRFISVSRGVRPFCTYTFGVPHITAFTRRPLWHLVTVLGRVCRGSCTSFGTLLAFAFTGGSGCVPAEVQGSKDCVPVRCS